MKANNCLSFLPFGFNNHYVHLPKNSSFCVEEGNKSNQYITEKYGGRILSNKITNNKIQVFGDSQVLGLDVEKIEQHYLYNLYKKKDFFIYAAPNNGPYQVINFLNKNKNILQKKIIVTFNLSTDLFRVLDHYNPENFVAMKDYELDEILENPLKYKFIIFKNILLRKNFTMSRHNNKKMQNLFLNSDYDQFYLNLNKYFNELKMTAKKNGLKIEFIITHPYWVYSIDKKNNKLLLDDKINDKIKKLICKSFQSSENINKIHISKVPKILNLEDLTFDRRHLKSSRIDLKTYQNTCINF